MEGAGPLICGEAPPASGPRGGGPLGSTLGWAWKEGKYSEGSMYSLTPHRLMVRVNFVYKAPFVGEGGESPQL